MKKIPYLHILLFICIVSIVSIPTLVFAQDGATQINRGLGTFSGIITTFTQTIVRSLATLFATAAMVAFFFGIVQFIWGSRDGDATKAKNGKNFMLWGLIALFVMFSVWGIVNYAQRIFGIQGQNTIIIPQIELGNGKTAPNPSGQGLPIQKSSYVCPNGTLYNDPSEQQKACFGTQGGSSNTSPCANDPNGLTQYDPESKGCVRPSAGGSGNTGANCTSNAECTGGLSCKNFTCQQPTSSSVVGSGNASAGCTSNAECTGGLTCQNFTCQQ